jgi:hypothetical protein
MPGGSSGGLGLRLVAADTVVTVRAVGNAPEEETHRVDKRQQRHGDGRVHNN